MDIKIADIFNSFYCDLFGLVKKKVILDYFSYDYKDELYYIRLMKGVGIFNTDLYMVQVLKKVDHGYSRQNDLNNQFHSESKAIDYISELISGEVIHAQ
jgi:hypothetical protein